MICRLVIFSLRLTLHLSCGVSCAETTAASNEKAVPSDAGRKIQYYIDHISKNDYENREETWHKPPPQKTVPGWRSR